MTESAPIKRALEHAPVLFPRDANGELLVGGQRLSVLAERRRMRSPRTETYRSLTGICLSLAMPEQPR